MNRRFQAAALIVLMLAAPIVQAAARAALVRVRVGVETADAECLAAMCRAVGEHGAQGRVVRDGSQRWVEIDALPDRVAVILASLEALADGRGVPVRPPSRTDRPESSSVLAPPPRGPSAKAPTEPAEAAPPVLPHSPPAASPAPDLPTTDAPIAPSGPPPSPDAPRAPPAH